MRHFTAGIALFVGLGGLAACAASDGTGPAEGPELAVNASAGLVCDISALKKSARAYFADGRDPIFTIISALQTASRNGPSAATTDLALDGWSRIAQVRLTSLQKTGATGVEGNAVARGLLGCGEPAFIAAVGEDIDFTSALDAGGMFEVRGDDAQDPPTAPAYSRGGSEVWAAHPQSTSTWGASAGARHAIYGHATDLTTNDEPVSAQAFQFETAPSSVAYSPSLVRGVCNIDITTSTIRIQRNQSLLLYADLDCAGAATASRSTDDDGVMLAVARRVAGLFVPRSLNASLVRGGVGGLASDFSPHIAVDLKRVNVVFVSQPIGGLVNQPIIGGGTAGVVQVRVTTAAGTPLPGVLVTLAVAGNEGTTVSLSNATAATDDDGIASYPDLSLNKAGGYTLFADGTYDAITGQTGTSLLFNIKNQ
jgi:hypothetical protein